MTKLAQPTKTQLINLLKECGLDWEISKYKGVFKAFVSGTDATAKVMELADTELPVNIIDHIVDSPVGGHSSEVHITFSVDDIDYDHQLALTQQRNKEFDEAVKSGKNKADKANKKKEVKVTDKERQVLEAFNKSEYCEVDGEGSSCWMFSIREHSGLSVNSFNGTLSNMIKKGFITTDTTGDAGRDKSVKKKDTYTVSLTAIGAKFLGK